MSAERPRVDQETELEANPTPLRLLRLLDSSSDGVLWFRDGRVAWANRAAASCAGVESPRELLGKQVKELLTESSDDPPLWPDGGGEGLPVECRLSAPLGGSRAVLVRPVGDHHEPGAGAWLMRPATRMEMLEGELRHARPALDAAQGRIRELEAHLAREVSQREELLTVVSHELRTPVTVIAGFNKLLLSEKVGALTDEQRHFLTEASKSCRRLDSFIGNLMEAARDRQRDPVQLAEACLASMIEEVVAFLKPLLDERHLKVELELSEAARRARFDPMRIEQVLTNLIGNAIKYSPPGGSVVIGTRQLPSADPPRIEVAVTDGGPGIPEQDRERIFQAYVQAGETSQGGGLGLGLAICRRIVAAHGGEIRVTDADGGGSRFVFTVPGSRVEEDGIR